MFMVVPDAGKRLLLEWALTGDGSSYESFSIKLFKNDYTPDDDTVIGDFDESDFGGYSEFLTARSDFLDPDIAGHVAFTDRDGAPEYSCTSGSAQDAYGWYMVGVDSSTVLFAQRFDFPRSMAPGATITLDPFRIKLKTFIICPP